MPSLSALEPAKKTSDKPSFVAVPLPNSNPTIGTGLGAAGLLFFRPSKKDTVSPSSLLALGGMYFDTKSWAAALGGRFHLREDRWRVTAAIAAADLRYDLSGGGEAGAPAVGVKQKTLGGLVQAQVRMFDRVYGGIRYVLAQVQTDLDSGEISLPTGITPDQANLRVAALGPVFSFDSRDNQFFPLHGWAADLRADFYGHDLGSEYGFQKYELNVRSFFPVRGQDVVAAQAYACGIGGRAPFFLQCLYGSGGVLRGYPVGKYYDETMFGAQVEYRWHFAPRWIAAGFAGIGGVAPTFGSYASDDLLPAAGLGVRWIAEPKEKATLRLDYAWGKDRGTFYLSIGEAF
jgi:outer membrane protein assembly factor BamA